MNTWVYIDHFKGEAVAAAWEVLGVGKRFGSVSALLIGSGMEALSATAFEFGVDKVLLGDETGLEDHRSDLTTTILAEAAREYKPDLILLPNTTRGRELAAMLAIDLKSGVMVDVIAVEQDADGVTVTRPIYGGKALSHERCSGTPIIITVRGRVFPQPISESGRRGEILRLKIASKPSLLNVGGTTRQEGGVSLSDAAVIVSGGRGVANNPALVPPAGMDEKQAEAWRAEQGFALVKKLATVLGGAVGASRAVVDAGFIPYSHQVGQTGRVVSPDVYIACGISGAIQHLAGMRTSKVIIAINKDPEAPIFKLARFGAVGDLFQILPALISALERK